LLYLLRSNCELQLTQTPNSPRGNGQLLDGLQPGDRRERSLPLCALAIALAPRRPRGPSLYIIITSACLSLQSGRTSCHGKFLSARALAFYGAALLVNVPLFVSVPVHGRTRLPHHARPSYSYAAQCHSVAVRDGGLSGWWWCGFGDSEKTEGCSRRPGPIRRSGKFGDFFGRYYSKSSLSSQTTACDVPRCSVTPRGYAAVVSAKE